MSKPVKKKVSPNAIQIRDPDGELGLILDKIAGYRGLNTRSAAVRFIALAEVRKYPPQAK
jgi:hypothetical protein